MLADRPAADRPAATIIALESLYELPFDGEKANFTTYPFDLIRSPINSAPEYEHARLCSTGSLFERCAVYDGGVRAFTPFDHGTSRSSWWTEVVDRGVRLHELADLTAGLSPYRLPFEQWARTIPWADEPGIASQEIYDLGRKALELSVSTETGSYVSTLLAEIQTPEPKVQSTNTEEE